MRKRVYVETTVISYLVARPTRDLVIAAHQELTREWWDKRGQAFDLYVSELVREEASQGDEEAAVRRLEMLEGVVLLDLNEEVADIAEALIAEGPLPQAAADDAVHLALATAHGMDFLLTWNCRHLANAEWTEAMADLLRAKGYRPPVVCTPEELRHIGGLPEQVRGL